MILRFLLALVVASSAWMLCSSVIFYDAPLWALWLVATSIALILIHELFEGLRGVHVAARPAVIAREQTHTPPV